jgi:HlyD family secretion protein
MGIGIKLWIKKYFMPEHTTYNEQQEMQQIIGSMPYRNWHRGILIVLMMMAMMIFIAWLVRYPDVIEVPVVISTQQPSIEIKAGIDQEVEYLLVSDGKEVQQGDVLVVFKSGIKYQEVVQLEQYLKTLDKKESAADVLSMPFSKGLGIGTLQGQLGGLEMSIRKLEDQYLGSHTAQRIVSLKGEQGLIKVLNGSLQKQIEKLEQEVEIAKLNYESYDKLKHQGFGYQLEVDAAKSNWLTQDRLLESKHSEIIQNDLNAKQIDGQILFLEQTEQQTWQENFRQVKQQASALLGQVERWKQTYLLIAPVSGKLIFTERRAIGQFIPKGTTVFSITTEDAIGELYAIGELSGLGAGKAKKDMTAFIRLTSFPYKEFGELEGKIEHIADAPAVKNGFAFYQVDIRLPNQLKTNFDRPISFRQEMPGIARIITEDRSLLQRFFNLFYL